jgi:hypothetical protein
MALAPDALPRDGTGGMIRGLEGMLMIQFGKSVEH